MNGFNQSEREAINEVLQLNKPLKNGNNIIQHLMNEKRHRNLVYFLLKTDAIQLPLLSVNKEKETTLMTLKRHIQTP